VSGSSGSANAGSTGGQTENYSLSGCGCTSVMDPGFAGLALLLLGFRRRRR